MNVETLKEVLAAHALYVLPEVADGPRFVAGCRNFTTAEAGEHWGSHSSRHQPGYFAAIDAWLSVKDGAA